MRESRPALSRRPTRFLPRHKAGGTQALVWGGHCEYAVAPMAEIVPVPDGLDSLHATLAKLMAIAYHGLRMSRPAPHETVFVLGLGPIGRLSAALHAATGARVIAADLHPARRAAAEAAGIETVDPADSLVNAFTAVAPEKAQIVVEATGAVSVFPDCARLLRDLPWDDHPHDSARLLVQATYADNPAFPYWELFHTEASILVPRDCQLRRPVGSHAADGSAHHQSRGPRLRRRSPR